MDGAALVVGDMPLETALNVTGLLSTAISGDFNGDGLSDLAQLQGGTVSVNFGVADGRRISRVDVKVAGFFGELVGGDWNGDGKTDLLRCAQRRPEAYAWTSDGAGFTTSLFANGISDTKRLRVADFNGDGRIDLFRLTMKRLLHFHLSEGDDARPVSPPTGLGSRQPAPRAIWMATGARILPHERAVTFWVHRAFNEVSGGDGCLRSASMASRCRGDHGEWPPTPLPAFTTELWGTDDEGRRRRGAHGRRQWRWCAPIWCSSRGAARRRCTWVPGGRFLRRAWGGGTTRRRSSPDLDSDGWSDPSIRRDGDAARRFALER
ncbi:MAG: VCBS repeat-containing protein [Myxococcales bacterium]|nr:VCBS repeat-containing protein [Myxococcales bacterium]